jgi:exonuclease VII large subunit
MARAVASRRRLPDSARRLAAVDRSGPARRGLERASAHLHGVDWRGPPVRCLEQARSRLSGDRRHLDAVSPKGVLARGYAVIRTPGGQILRDAAGLRQGDPIDVQLASGRLTARVEEVVDERR